MRIRPFRNGQVGVGPNAVPPDPQDVLGAFKGEIEAVGDDARGWLMSQIRPDGAPSPQGDLPTTDERAQDWLAYQQTGQQRRQIRRREGTAPENASPPAAMACDVL